MSERKIVVPEEMLKAAGRATSDVDPEGFIMLPGLIAALRWLSENPIIPSDEQVAEMRDKLVPVHPHWANIVCEWQRRMFIAPEPEIPKAIKDLMDPLDPNNQFLHNQKVLEAYRRGRESK